MGRAGRRNADAAARPDSCPRDCVRWHSVQQRGLEDLVPFRFFVSTPRRLCLRAAPKVAQGPRERSVRGAIAAPASPRKESGTCPRAALRAFRERPSKRFRTTRASTRAARKLSACKTASLSSRFERPSIPPLVSIQAPAFLPPPPPPSRLSAPAQRGFCKHAAVERLTPQEIARTNKRAGAKGGE